jgi:hypothetical protein
VGANKSNLIYSIDESKTEGMWVEKGDNRRGSGGGGGGQTWKASPVSVWVVVVLEEALLLSYLMVSLWSLDRVLPCPGRVIS